MIRTTMRKEYALVGVGSGIVSRDFQLPYRLSVGDTLIIEVKGDNQDPIESRVKHVEFFVMDGRCELWLEDSDCKDAAEVRAAVGEMKDDGWEVWHWSSELGTAP